MMSRNFNFISSISLVAMMAITQAHAQQFQQIEPKGNAEALQPVFSNSKNIESAIQLMEKEYKKVTDDNFDKIANYEEMYQTGNAELMSKLTPEKLAEVRDSLIQRAYLQAQTKIINSIFSTFSASSIFEMEKSPLSAKFSDQKSRLQKEIAALEQQIKDEAFKIDQNVGLSIEAELKSGEGVQLLDRASRLGDAIIKKLDDTYSPRQLAQEKTAEAQQRAQKFSQLAENSKNKIEALKKMSDALNEQLEEEKTKFREKMTNAMEMTAAMPLLGTVVINSAESYIGEKYQVSLLLKWSARNEKFATAILNGVPLTEEKAGKNTIKGWLDSIDKGVMIGGAAFTDNKANRWYIGCGSYPTLGGGSYLTQAERLSNMFAQRNLIFSLFSNAKMYEKASQTLATLQAKGQAADVDSMQSLQSSMSAEFSNVSLSNVIDVVQEEVFNPILGEKMYLTCKAINPNGNARTLESFKKTSAAVIQITNYQAQIKGEVRGLREAEKAAVDGASKIESSAAAASKQEMLAPKAVSQPVTPRNPSTSANGGLLDGATASGNRSGGSRSRGGFANDD